MFAQPPQMVPQQIARIVEETVNNLRELETRLDVLRTDLALLCQSIGHPEAAQKVLTARAAQIGQVGVPNIAGVQPAFAPTSGAIGGANPAYAPAVNAFMSPWASATPFGATSPWNVTNVPNVANVNAFSATNPWAAVNPYAAANPWNVGSAANVNPWANVSPFSAVNPYGANPFAGAVNPYVAAAGVAPVSAAAWGAPWPSSAFSNPYAFPR